ncbi:hypothetical protein Tco_1227293 [Tanacetum coccineum]
MRPLAGRKKRVSGTRHYKRRDKPAATRSLSLSPPARRRVPRHTQPGRLADRRTRQRRKNRVGDTQNKDDKYRRKDGPDEGRRHDHGTTKKREKGLPSVPGQEKRKAQAKSRNRRDTHTAANHTSEGDDKTRREHKKCSCRTATKTGTRQQPPRESTGTQPRTPSPTVYTMREPWNGMGRLQPIRRASAATRTSQDR